MGDKRLLRNTNGIGSCLSAVEKRAQLGIRSTHSVCQDCEENLQTRDKCVADTEEHRSSKIKTCIDHFWWAEGKVLPKHIAKTAIRKLPGVKNKETHTKKGRIIPHPKPERAPLAEGFSARPTFILFSFFVSLFVLISGTIII